jgi:hypothetical protein
MRIKIAYDGFLRNASRGVSVLWYLKYMAGTYECPYGYELLYWGNERGWVTGFKAWSEDQAFMVHPSGYALPWSLYSSFVL